MNRIIAIVLALFLSGGPLSAALDGSGDDGLFQNKSTSAIDRADFKIRNVPYKVEPAAPDDRPTEAPMEFGEQKSSTLRAPTPDEIYAEVPEDLIIEYVDHVDHGKRMTAPQMAQKYLGFVGEGRTIPAEPQDQTLYWLMLSERDHRAAKSAWFNSARSSIPLDEFNRVVDLRRYRVKSALKLAEPPILRSVEGPASAPGATGIEKLRMPDLKPLGGWDRHPNAHLPGPAIRPLETGPEPPPARPARRPETVDQEGADDLESRAPPEQMPSFQGIPGSLRNSP